MTPQRPNWHTLAEQVSKELDPIKLMSLVDELNRAWSRTKELPSGCRLSNLFDISARSSLPPKARFLARAFPFNDNGEESSDTRLTMVNPEPARVA
jgi:hypothetical protein